MVPEKDHNRGLPALPQGRHQLSQGLIRPGNPLQHHPDNIPLCGGEVRGDQGNLAFVVEFLRLEGLVVLHGDAKEESPLPALVHRLHPFQHPLEEVAVPHVEPAVGPVRPLNAHLLNLVGKIQIVEAQQGIGHRPVIQCVIISVEHFSSVITGFRELLRQGVKALVNRLVLEADVRPRRQVQGVQPVEHGNLQIPGAVAQVMAVEGPADALRLQGVEVLQGVPLVLKHRQAGQVIKGLGEDEKDIRPGLRLLPGLRQLVDARQHVQHEVLIIPFRRRLGLGERVPPEAEGQAVEAVVFRRVHAGVKIHSQPAPHGPGPGAGEENPRQGQRAKAAPSPGRPLQGGEPPGEQQKEDAEQQPRRRRIEVLRRRQIPRQARHVSRLLRKAEVRQLQGRSVDGVFEVVHQGQNQPQGPRRQGGQPQPPRQGPQDPDGRGPEQGGHQQMAAVVQGPLRHAGEGANGNPLHGPGNRQPHAEPGGGEEDAPEPEGPQGAFLFFRKRMSFHSKSRGGPSRPPAGLMVLW